MSQRSKHNSGRLSVEGKRLLISILLFVICFAGRVSFPAQTQRAADCLKKTMSASSQFESAFSTLGSDLNSGKSLTTSVGSWCVTVFAPQEITIPENTTEKSEKQASSFTEGLKQQLKDHLRQWLHGLLG